MPKAKRSAKQLAASKRNLKKAIQVFKTSDNVRVFTQGFLCAAIPLTLVIGYLLFGV